MVTLFKNDFTGQTAGPATVANSGNSGDAFSHLVASSGASYNYIDADGQGNMALLLSPGTGQSYPRWTSSGTDGRRCVGRRLFTYQKDMPYSGAVSLVDIRTEVNATAALGSIHIRNVNHQLQARYGSGTDVVASRFVLPDEVGVYQIEFGVTVSSEADEPDGEIGYRLWDAAGTELLHSWSSGPTLVINPSPPNIVRYASGTNADLTGPGGSNNLVFDEMQALFTDDLYAWLGPFDGTRMLETPTPSISATTRPTTPGGSDGTITVVWPKIEDEDVDHYEIATAVGFGATGGFTSQGTIPQPVEGSTVSATVTGLAPGEYTVAVRANPGEAP